MLASLRDEITVKWVGCEFGGQWAKLVLIYLNGDVNTTYPHGKQQKMSNGQKNVPWWAWFKL